MDNYKTYLLNNYFRNTTPRINNNAPSLYTPDEGYNKGNLFSNLYDSYKNYKPIELVPKSEEEALLLDISQNVFAAHELNLYLDLFPSDVTMLALFNDYREKANELTKQYESTYGPLTVSSDNLTSTFLWEKQAWPWEGENV